MDVTVWSICGRILTSCEWRHFETHGQSPYQFTIYLILNIFKHVSLFSTTKLGKQCHFDCCEPCQCFISPDTAPAALAQPDVHLWTNKPSWSRWTLEVPPTETSAAPADAGATGHLLLSSKIDLKFRWNKRVRFTSADYLDVNRSERLDTNSYNYISNYHIYICVCVHS